SASLNYCCTTPLPSGPGNITNDPQIARLSDPYLQPGSPCIDTGTNVCAAGACDLDDEPRTNGVRVDIGCDEFWSESFTGAVGVSIWAGATNARVEDVIEFNGVFTGKLLHSVWLVSDGYSVTNVTSFSHSFSTTGVYTVECLVSNYTNRASATVAVDVAEWTIHYVADSGSNTSPYTNWTMAAWVIQDAVDASAPGDTVLVTNGIYDMGGRAVYSNMTNRVAIDKAITVQSVNGPGVTTIRGQKAPGGCNGDGAIRCVYLTNGAALIGFTLTNGATRMAGDAGREQGGGGVWCESLNAVVSNCVMAGNSAQGVYNEDGGGAVYRGTVYNSVISGNTSVWRAAGAVYSMLHRCILTDNMASSGGALGSTLYNCLLRRNWANDSGGAGVYCTFNNCTLIDNNAMSACGGIYGGALTNCIVYFNSSRYGNLNYGGSASLNYCCTTPLPSGPGNITNDPQIARLSDPYLQPGSPCVNAGWNESWMTNALDFDGNPRIIDSEVDIGAYEAPYMAMVRVFLQGPHGTNTECMSLALSQQDRIPFQSPYAADPRSVSQIPTNVTDWILVETLVSPQSSASKPRAAFLRNDGYLLSSDGTLGVPIGTAPGNCFLVIKHRNHLAVMTAGALIITNINTSFDFTTNFAQFYGGTNGAVQLEPGVWGMIAGDADGDGKITAVDKAICEQQAGMSGYLSGDFDLDGQVEK
ncbi:MAG: right-handed parallel beta-helix repeat-containing protein, partial [Lentisphaerota bacterium]